MSSARAINRSPSCRTSRPRSRADNWLHGPFSAARAASTAASTSLRSADATSAITSSVAGFSTLIVLPEEEGRHSLPMNRYLVSTVAELIRTPHADLRALQEIRRQGDQETRRI